MRSKLGPARPRQKQRHDFLDPGGLAGALTLLASVLEKLGAVYAKASEEALRLAERVLAPAGPIPRRAVRGLLGRALRNGAWGALPWETRALLLATARAPVRVYRSPMLLALLRRVWLLVELATMRGKAVVAALTHLLARGVAQGLYSLLRRGLDKLIAIGIQVLNNPWLQGIIPAT